MNELSEHFKRDLRGTGFANRAAGPGAVKNRHKHLQ
jgi:hypothetical protein